MKPVYAIGAFRMMRGWVEIFGIFHYWGSFVTSSKDPIECSLPTVLLPLGMLDAKTQPPKNFGINLGDSIRWVPFNASHNLRCECIKRAYLGKFISFNVKSNSTLVDCWPSILATGLSSRLPLNLAWMYLGHSACENPYCRIISDWILVHVFFSVMTMAWWNRSSIFTFHFSLNVVIGPLIRTLIYV